MYGQMARMVSRRRVDRDRQQAGSSGLATGVSPSSAAQADELRMLAGAADAQHGSAGPLTGQTGEPVQMTADVADQRATATGQVRSDQGESCAPEGQADLYASLVHNLDTLVALISAHHDELTDLSEDVAIKQAQWARFVEAAGVAHADAKRGFEGRLAEQSRSERAAVELLMGALGIATGGLWTYADSLTNLTEQLSNAARGLRVAVGLFTSDRTNALIDAGLAVGGELIEEAGDAAGEAASELVTDLLAPELTSGAAETTPEFRERLLSRVGASHLELRMSILETRRHLSAQQRIGLEDQLAMSDWRRSGVPAVAVERLVDAWRVLAECAGERAQVITQAVAASPMMQDPPALSRDALTRTLERVLWADWLRRHLDAEPRVTCPTSYAQEGVDVPRFSASAGSHCEVTPAQTYLGLHITTRLRQLGIPTPGEVGNAGVLAWARSYTPEVLF